jgi:tryptophan-rich sensory protein
MKLALWLTLSLLVSALGGLITSTEVSTWWYAQLRKPAFQPPAWLFAPIWFTLYTTMAIAAWRVHRKTGTLRHPAIYAYFMQLLLNGLWTLLFFGTHAIGLALADIVALFAMILLTAHHFRSIDRPAAMMIVPYAGWVAFAAALNLRIWRLNS